MRLSRTKQRPGLGPGSHTVRLVDLAMMPFTYNNSITRRSVRRDLHGGLIQGVPRHSILGHQFLA